MPVEAAPATRPMASNPPPARPGRRRPIVFAVVVTTIALLGWAGNQIVHDRVPTPRQPEPSTSSAPTSAPGAGGGPAPVAPMPIPDVGWHDFAGLSLPVSRVAGPHCETANRAACFAQTGPGAALAAVHLLVRTFPFAGTTVFAPTIAEQVTGPDAPTLARLTAQAYDQLGPSTGVHPGDPIRSEGGWVAGYHLDDLDPARTEATVRVLIRQSGEAGTEGFTEYTVQLRWVGGDWKILAPAWGDWRSNARAMQTADPAFYTGYDQVGSA